MKHVIVVQNGSRLVGVFSNVKRVYDAIESKIKPSYSTVAGYLANLFPVDFGMCVFEGVSYENLVIRKCEVNKVYLVLR